MKKKSTKRKITAKSKTKRIAKKSAGRMISIKALKKKKAQLKVTTNTKKIISAAAHAPVPPIPSRAPTRKILDGSNKLRLVPEAAQAALKEIQTEPVKQVAVEETTQIIVPMPKYMWQDLPSHIPAHIKFVVSMAQKECENAKNWPFPFAKYIAALPEEICGRDFALLLLSLERDTSEIVRLCKISQNIVEASIARGSQVMRDKFVAMCEGLDRKLRTQLTGHGMSVELLIDRHLVAKVDRNFQVAIATILLKDMRAENVSMHHGTNTPAVANC